MSKSLISERQAAKMALLMQQRFASLIQFAEQRLEEVQTVEQKVATQQTLDYVRTLQDEMIDVFREMAKPEPDKARILAWVSEYGGDQEAL